MIIDYCVIEAGDVDHLEEDVKSHIDKGWQPFGGITIQRHAVVIRGSKEYQWYYFQAMVKYSEV